MKLLVIVCLAGMAAGLPSAQSCCSTASDCTDQLSTADIVSRFIPFVVLRGVERAVACRRQLKPLLDLSNNPAAG